MKAPPRQAAEVSVRQDIDTIYALSSGALPCGVCVIRLSGPSARFAVERLAGTVPVDRRATLRTIRSRNGNVIDTGLVLFFAGPNSFTGEDSTEFQLHGGRAVVDALFSELSALGCRPAEAGEFTRRAYENGKIDLVEAEGLVDLLAAETEMQRRFAVEQSSGRLSKLYDSWAERILSGRALIEAELDFADEDDIPGSVSDRVWADIDRLVVEMRNHIAQFQEGEIIRTGFKVVLAGPPNAGKSSLMNALAARDVAIVTDQPGTTRDVLEVALNIQGYLVRLFDTAGLRDAEDLVEREGIRRARQTMDNADLVLFLDDGSGNDDQDPLPANQKDIVTVLSKADLRDRSDGAGVAISTMDGTGIAALEQMIADRLSAKISGSDFAIPSRARHKYAIEQALGCLEKAMTARHATLDVRAEELRLAQEELAAITGRRDVEQMLDLIFSQFCVGK